MTSVTLYHRFEILFNLPGIKTKQHYADFTISEKFEETTTDEQVKKQETREVGCWQVLLVSVNSVTEDVSLM